MKNIKKYYEVIAKCGHVGKKHYIPITFAVKASSGVEAASRVRDYSRVKHAHKDAILSVIKINYVRYKEIHEINSNDPYLACHSKQEQNFIENIYERLVDDHHNEKIIYEKQKRLDRVAYKIKKNKVLEKEFISELVAMRYDVFDI